MATFNRFNTFNLDLAHKVHHLGTDVLKVYLSNSSPDIVNHVNKSDIPDLSTGGGYTAGGAVASVVSSSQAGGVYRLILSDPLTWVGTGSGFGPFRYSILYNDTTATDRLIGYWEYPTTIPLVANGETFRLDLDQTNGVIVIQ